MLKHLLPKMQARPATPSLSDHAHTAARAHTHTHSHTHATSSHPPTHTVPFTTTTTNPHTCSPLHGCRQRCTTLHTTPCDLLWYGRQRLPTALLMPTTVLPLIPQHPLEPPPHSPQHASWWGVLSKCDAWLVLGPGCVLQQLLRLRDSNRFGGHNG